MRDRAPAEQEEEVRIPGSREAVLALSIPLLFVGGSCAKSRSPRNVEVIDAINSSRPMPDGKQWTTRNLNLDIAESYCYADTEPNCGRYGRLYSWHSAQIGCHSLGEGWRLPSNDEWRQLAKQYGGVRDDTDDGGKGAYKALSSGGSSGFNAVLGGGRDADGQYARLEAHGFYWTASESDSASAWLYNFGRGALILNRHSDGEKQRAYSVRCVRE